MLASRKKLLFIECCKFRSKMFSNRLFIAIRGGIVSSVMSLAVRLMENHWSEVERDVVKSLSVLISFITAHDFHLEFFSFG